MPEVSLGVFLLCGGYGAYRLLGLVHQLKNGREWVARVALLAGAWLVGIALAAPLLLPLFEFVAHSAHSSTGVLRSSRETFGVDHAPLTDFVFWFMPYLNAPPLYANKAIYFSTYAGASVLVLAIYGLHRTPTELYRRLVPFAALAAALLLAISFGVPGVAELGRLPGLNVTRIPYYFAPVTGFCLALIASVGVHQLTVGRRPVLAASALTVLGVLVLLGVYANWTTMSRNWGNHVYFSIGVAVLFAFAVWLTIQFLPTHLGVFRGVACCVLLVGELFLLAPHGVYQDRYERFAEAPYVTFLKEKQETSAFRIFGADAMLMPNFASALGLHDIRAYTPLLVDRFRIYIQQFISPNVIEKFTGLSYPDPDEEKDALILNNPWFDLTGVRYVVVEPGSQAAVTVSGVPITGEIYTAAAQAGPTAGYNDLDHVTIDGITRWALVEYPPTKVSYPVRIEATNSILGFAVGLMPEVWDPEKGDGVRFGVEVETAGKSKQVYSREIDPKNDPADRRWIEERVDLSRYVGQDILLTFITKPLESQAHDQAVWADIRLTSPQYTLVYDDEAQIFENHDVLPRAFLVQDVVSVNDMEEALAVMKEDGIDPRQTAVVEGASESHIAALGADGAGTATITAYNAQHAQIEVEAKSPSLLLLTDSAYPGWIATVDGDETPIYAADVAFRGVFVPAGRHSVEFSYEPASFRIGAAIAVLGLIGLLAVVAGLNPRRWLSR
jgi:hypothetical protein